MNGEQAAVKTKVYFRPQEAARKLKVARELKQPCYLYGMTGAGKTTLVREFLGRRQYAYFRTEETEPEQIRVEKDGRDHIVVIDNLYRVMEQSYQERYAAVIGTLLARRDVWLVLISRAPVPGWLLPLHVRYELVQIAEKDFYLSKKQMVEWLEQCEVYLGETAQEQVWELTGGHPISVRLLTLERGDIDRTIKRMWLYLENHVYDQWNVELQEFLMETSIVERYTKELAGMITGRGNVEELLFRAEELGNFMTLTGEDGVWEYRWAMRESMKSRLLKRYSREQVQRLYAHAGLYYELHDQYGEALEMYEACGDRGSMLRVLIANARRNPSTGKYYELRSYYLELPEKLVAKSPALISYMSMLQSVLMNEEESERWYGILKAYTESHTGSEKREGRGWLLYLEIALPHRGSVNLVTLLKHAGSLLGGQRLVLSEFSVTTNLPSLMNGGKDFCEWSKRDRELAASIGKAVEFVLGKYGKGLVSLALAESGLEKGGDEYEIMQLTEKGRMEAESGGKVELCFVASGMLAWLAVIGGNAAYAEDILKRFRERAEREAAHLLPNLDGLLCRICLYQGRLSETVSWMEHAPEEQKEFSTLERFRYLTKVRCYLQSGKYEAACGLLQQLLHYAEKMKRTYIGMEASLLLAVTLYRMGRENWREVLQTCVTQAESYHFVRLISREGTAVLELLEQGKLVWTDPEFQQQVLEECRKMRKQYPGYLVQGVDDVIRLSENARRILQLQAEGVSIKEIAQRLNIKTDTVKYHSRETYRKLGVRTRTEAVNEARKRKLI